MADYLLPDVRRRRGLLVSTRSEAIALARTCYTAKQYLSGICYYCIANFYHRSNVYGHFFYRGENPYKTWEYDPVKKPSEQPVSAGNGVVPTTCKLLSKHPLIWEFLCCTKWDDGSDRMPGTISMFAEDGQLKVALNDRSMERSLYVSGVSLDAILASLERKLADGSDHDWRAWKKPGKGKRA